MPDGIIRNNKAFCPECGSDEYKTYRRATPGDGNVICYVRCLKCDFTYEILLDRLGDPVAPDDGEGSPFLPFEGEER